MKKLKEQVFHLIDAEGNDHPEEQQNIGVAINGVKPISKESVFCLTEFEDGELYGTSLLSYFTPKDGKLVHGNTTVEFFNIDTNAPLKVTEITRPSFTNDVEINLEYVSLFSQLMGVPKPEELFADILDEGEKKTLIAEREARIKEQTETATKEREAKIIAEVQKADTLVEEISKEQDAGQLKAVPENKYYDRIITLDDDLLPEGKKTTDIHSLMVACVETLTASAQQVNNESEEIEKKEKELMGAINPDYLVTPKKYSDFISFYVRNNGWKEFIKAPLHFFYSPNWSEEQEDPFVLIKRGRDFFEEVATELIEETDKVVSVEYTDGGEVKTLQIDLEKGEIITEETAKA